MVKNCWRKNVTSKRPKELEMMMMMMNPPPSNTHTQESSYKS